MRILVCTNSYPPRIVGRAELVAHRVVREMAHLGREVAVFAGDLDGPGEHHTVTTDPFDGVRVYRVATRPADYAPVTPNYVNADIDAHFSTILREFCPTVVRAHNLIGLSVRMLITARESGARVFVTLYDFWGFCLRNTLMLENGMLCSDRSACADCLRNPDGVDVSLFAEAGYAIPSAWLTKLQRQSVSAFLLVRARNGQGALARRLFGIRVDINRVPRALVWLGKAFLRRGTDKS